MKTKALCCLIVMLNSAALASENPKTPWQFDPQGFQNPPALFWPGSFWVWNDRIDAATITDQLREMHAHGMRSVCMLPEPAEFRPTTMGTRLEPTYLTEPYFKMVRNAAAESQRLGMNFWLYDEGGWPSGSACGRVTHRNPKAAAKVLRCEEVQPKPNTPYVVPADAVCAAVSTQDACQVYRPGQSIGNIPANARLRLFVVQRRGYADLLSADATRTFLDLTHEGYKRFLSDYFGQAIRYTFTDEPGALPANPDSQLTWTDDFAQFFAAAKGYDLVPWLPKILGPGVPPAANPADKRERIRVLLDYYDVRATLFRQRYLEPIRAWCAANHLQSSGHLNGENEPIGNATYGYGHILRSLRGLDLPGTDVIWRQLFPGVASRPFAKYASSVARQKGQPLVLTESFCVYGSGITPTQMRWVTDHQYVRGTNVTVVGCYPLSTRDHLMPGERPHFGPTNPLWPYLDIFNTYTARLGYLLTRGQPVSSIAVYYDVRSIWAGGSDRERAIRLHDGLAEALLSRQREFDFIDDDVLSGREGRVDNGVLAVGPMRYDTVIVPVTAWMEPAALDGLAQLAKSGATVIAVEGIPQADGGTKNLLDAAGVSAKPDQSEISVGRGRIVIAPLDKAAELPASLVRLDPACADIRVCKQAGDHMALYFLTNQADRPVSVTAHFQETTPAVVCDLEEGLRRPLTTRTDASGSAADLVFEPCGSMVILFGSQPDAPLRPESGQELLSLKSGWTLRPLRQYRIGENDYEVRSLPDTKAKPVELGDWRDTLGAGFSGDAEYATTFDWNPQSDVSGARLELGNVQYVCQVFLNDQPVGRRIWAPFAVDLTGKLRPGRNQLRMIVTNTLANALLDPAAREHFAHLKKGLCYDDRAAKFEQESLPSGLLGPVRIVQTK